MLSPDFCPYKGLQPYAEADRAYFFGRERDSEIIVSNLFAAPLTILYGESGVGKSSVLLAGVLPPLRQTPRVVALAFRTWQDNSFLPALKQQLLDAAGASLGKTAGVDPNLPLDDFLLELARALHGRVLVILDQFEEYFLYHEPTEGDDGFDAQFARAVNRREVPANFLICLREDSLSRLDRFKGRIPNLLGNMLRLTHLDHDAAESAIRNPLTEFNRHLAAGQAPVTIEPELVEAVISQVRTGQINLGQGPAGQATPSDGVYVETPYLQLVMTRLWEAERAANSSALRLATFEKLGGAKQIVRTHLDARMAQLPAGERLAAARAFRFLVTPSGTKIAYSAFDLANYAGVPVTQLKPVLNRLAAPEVRVLRAVAPPGAENQEPRYEIFHDVLAPAILDWRERYLREARAKEVRRAFFALGGGSLLLIAVLIGISLTSTRAAQTAMTQASAAQAQEASARQTGDAVGGRATQVSKERATREYKAEVQFASTRTAAAVQLAQASDAQDARAQAAIQAAQTQAANAAVLSLALLAAPTLSASPPPSPGPYTPGTLTPTPANLFTRATAAAVATSAAQVLQFAINDVSVAVSPDSSDTCPARFTFTGVINANRAGTLSYNWERSDGSSSNSSPLAFPRAGSQTVTDTWPVSGVLAGWERLNILAPAAQSSNQAAFSVQPAGLPGALQEALTGNSATGARLGCPQGGAASATTVQQVYQNGLMIWRKDTLQIYVLLDDGTWSVYPDTWSESQRQGRSYTPPAGLVEPVRGFGKVWREQLGGPDAAIGWATTPEVAVSVQIQTFQNGFAVMDEDRDIKVFFPNRNWTGL